MGLTKMEFSPATGLRDTTAYASEPATGTAAREQVQGRLDEVMNYLNNVLTVEIDTKLAPIIGVTATPTELNVLGGIPTTLTATELGYVDGVTSAIQTQLNAKSPLSTLATASLVAATWTGASAPFSYVLAVAGVTATSNQEVLPTITITAAELLALQSANIIDGGQAAGSITLLAYGTKPVIAIPIRVIKRGDIA